MTRFQKYSMKRSVETRDRGFALVATITVMVLIMLMAVGMVSLSALESRMSRQDRYTYEARANARMALLMALGELQEKLGKDQRVTAEADILGGGGFSGIERHPTKQHYVGVYSTESWAERDSQGRRGVWKKYDADRNKDAFMGWLVSGDPGEVDALDFAKTESTGGAYVNLLGVGALGEGASEEEKMPVPTVEVIRDGSLVGRYAWGALDQGVKANVALAQKRELASSVEDYEPQLNLMSQQTMGVDAISGYANFEDEGNEGNIERLLTRDQLKLIGSGLVSPAAVRNSYHDTTVYSRSVLSDVLKGGLKRDLSLAFELPDDKASDSATDWEYDLNKADSYDDRHRTFTSIWGLNNSGDQMSNWRHARMIQSGYRPYWWAKKMGYVFAYPEGGSRRDRVGSKRYLRGPSWDLLRSHYRRYKRDFEGLSATHRDRRGVRAPADDKTWLATPYQPYSFQADSFGSHLLSHSFVGESKLSAGGYRAESVWDPFYRFDSAATQDLRPWNVMGFRTYGLTPVVTKFGFVISIYTEPRGGRKNLSLCIDAVGNVWNPYNVPIEAEALLTQIKLDGLRWSLECKRAGGGTEQWASEPGKSGYAADRAFPFKHIRIGVANPLGGNGRPASNLRLMPGEVRTFALDFPSPKGYRYDRLETEPGKFTNNWNGGYYLRHSNKWLLDDGDKLRFILKPDDGERSSFSTVLGYFEQLTGARYNPFDADTRDTLIDQPELSSMHITKSSEMFDGNSFETTVSNFPVGANNKKAIAYIEFKRPASDTADFGLATDVDPRSIVNHPKAMGTGAGVPDTWTAQIEKVSDFDLLQNGVGARNNGFYGTSHDGSGETHVTYYDVPTAPLVSLGSLQSAQLAATGWSSPYAIGSSFPHPLVPKDQVVAEKTSDGFDNVLYDLSYLVNAELWDGYFMSGLHLEGEYDENSGDGALREAEQKMAQFMDPTAENPLANKRVSLLPGADTLPDETLKKQLTHYRWIARNLMLDGGFNVNSTRKEAWKAWLTSAKGKLLAERNPVTGNMSEQSADGSPFSRLTVPAGTANEEWRGYAGISDAQIDELAEAIVEQVRLRGPFLSLGDFVNRRLATDETGDRGALEAALEDVFGVAGLGTGNERGIVGNVRQSDILATVGDVLVARSDTFVIRAYGEAINPGTGKVEAVSWCEAVVQRIPTPVDDHGVLLDAPNPDFESSRDPGGVDAYIENPDASEGAKKYGRRFVITSFRWLNKDEI